MSVCRSATVVLLAVSLTAIMGCAAATASYSPALANRGQDAIPSVTVEVANQHLAEVSVFALRGGERRLLGRVLPQGHARFAIPGRLMQPGLDLRLAVESRTSRYASEPILVEPGQIVALYVQPNVTTSSVAVR